MFHHTRLLHSNKAWRGNHAIRACALALGLACALTLYFISPLNPRTAVAQTGTIVQNDFEDGGLQGWIPRGGVTLTNTTEAAAGGTRSLKTTGRTQGFHGPSLNVLSLLSKGATYQITASVRLVAPTAATTVRVTMQQTPAGGSNQFVTIAQNTGVTDAAFVTLTGLFSFGADMTGLLLYVESTNATASYYLDNFSITLVAPAPGPPPNTTGAATDFETGEREGWAPRIGREVLTVTTADANSGNRSLLTTGRMATFDGPSLNVTNVMFNGSRYRVSLWAKLAPGEPNTQLRVSLQRNAGTITTFHTVIGNTNVTANQWVNLKTVFDVTLANTSLSLYVESASGTPSFYIDDVTITFVPPPVAERNIPSVFQTLAEFCPVGAAIHQGDLSGEHAVLLTKHFNSVTSENDMKWGTLQPTQGNFNFGPADAQVAFAKTNNMRIRGHTLVWHNQTPAWVFNDANGAPLTPTPENKALLLQRMETHIRTVMDHYKNDVYAWDVVNEVIDPSQPDGFRRSPWFNITGTDFIERAFRVAREVDPDCKLYINDFDTTNVAKRQFLFNLISDLKSRGVPIDGIGHQMHNNVDFPSAQAIIDTINMFHNLGVENEVTELDTSIYSGSNPPIFDDYALIPQELFVRQGYRNRIFFDVFRQLKGKIGSITFWGQADDHTWLTSSTRVNGPLLFDTSLKKKFAYWGVIDPLQLPGADLSTSVSAGSTAPLSGGDLSYTITVRNNQDNDLEDFLPDDDDLPAASVSMTDAIPARTVFKSLSAPPGWSCTTPAAGGAGQVNCTIASLAPGASAQFNLTVTVICATPNNTEIVNAATVTSTTRDPNAAPNNTASVNVRASNPPPTLSGISVDKTLLGPPNHRMVPVLLWYTTGDNCDTALVKTVTISSNEPENGTGDGDTAPDWVVNDPHHIMLRAERAGNGLGRIYTITVTVTDSAGSSTSKSTIVRVPH
ncbi:MAG TPA: endo-1,4-beta-xylanase [Blastocatellia bacterium]|nr:endo-1,4-beta-xylanase [Blastocatellia bacterium]